MLKPSVGGAAVAGPNVGLKKVKAWTTLPPSKSANTTAPRLNRPGYLELAGPPGRHLLSRERERIACLGLCAAKKSSGVMQIALVMVSV